MRTVTFPIRPEAPAAPAIRASHRLPVPLHALFARGSGPVIPEVTTDARRL
jgi:hypothetical protein